MTLPNNIFIDQLKTVVAVVDAIICKSQYQDSDLSDLSESDVRLGLSRMRAAVERAAPANSSYVRELNRLDSEGWQGHSGLAMYRGVVQSLLEDMRAGYTASIEELVHGEVFGDYLEMADHLLESGYKDAAAVIAGSTLETLETLETHLRNLCRKFRIDFHRTGSGTGGPKKAETMNTELAAIYGKLDQKNVTAWFDVRNKAAHGQYGEYSREQVALLIGSVRDFVTRNPA